jgi:hypothetical protein
MEVLYRGRAYVYAALPAGGYTQHEINRDLVPMTNGLAFGEFEYPGTQRLLWGGKSSVNLKVLDVGPKLIGEDIRVELDGPLDLKGGMGVAYGWLLLLWPVFVVSLAIYAITLISRGLRRAKDATASPNSRLERQRHE